MFYSYNKTRHAVMKVNRALTRKPRYLPKEVLPPEDKVMMKRGQEWRVSSRLIAERLMMDHENLVRVITRNKDELKSLGAIPNVEYKCCNDDANVNELFPDNLSENKSETRGRKQRHYLLNYDQLFILFSHLNGNEVNKELVSKLRISVVKNYHYIERQIAKRQVQIQSYTALRELVARLEVQPRVYMQIAAMENSFAGVERGTDRTTLPPDQMQRIEMASGIIKGCIDTALLKGQDVNEGLHQAAEVLNIISPKELRKTRQLLTEAIRLGLEIDAMERGE